MVTTKFHLGSCIIICLLTFGDSTDIFDNSIPPINRTASQGETVVLHCNGTEDNTTDVVWRKENITLYYYSPYINNTLINYTSSRMYVDPNNPLKLQISDVQPSDAGNYSCFPLRVHWILTIKVTQSKSELPRELLIYIVPSVAGAVAVCFIIICFEWIHRKRKKRNKEIGHESQPQGRRKGRVHTSQYFERFNSLYGEV